MVYNINSRVAEKRLVVLGDASIADVPSVQTVEPVGGADVQQYVTYVRLQDQAIYKDEVPRSLVIIRPKRVCAPKITKLW